MSEQKHGGGGQHGSVGQYEKQDIDARPITVSLIVLGVVCLVVIALTGVFFAMLENREVSTERRVEDVQPPEPRLQIQERSDMDAVRTIESEELSSYGWEDKANGVVRIPLDRAKQIVVERGTLIQVPKDARATPAAPGK